MLFALYFPSLGLCDSRQLIFMSRLPGDGQKPSLLRSWVPQCTAGGNPAPGSWMAQCKLPKQQNPSSSVCVCVYVCMHINIYFSLSIYVSVVWKPVHQLEFKYVFC